MSLSGQEATAFVDEIISTALAVARGDAPAEPLAAQLRQSDYRWERCPEEPRVDLMRWVLQSGTESVTRARLRQHLGTSGEPTNWAASIGGLNLSLLPRTLPADDDTAVLIYTNNGNRWASLLHLAADIADGIPIGDRVSTTRDRLIRWVRGIKDDDYFQVHGDY